MKNIILVTGGAGFVGSNLISFLLKKTNFKIISLDNYFTGNKKIILSIKELNILMEKMRILKKFYTNIQKICVIFHFGEFSRIYQTFFKLKNV